MEQDKPLDPLNIRRNRPDTVITGTHGPLDLLKQFGPGMIFSIFPVHVIWEYQLAGTIDPGDITSLLFIALVRNENYIQTWVQKQYQVSTAWNVSS